MDVTDFFYTIQRFNKFCIVKIKDLSLWMNKSIQWSIISSNLKALNPSTKGRLKVIY